MSEELTVTPSTPVVGTTVPVDGTGFDGSLKTRLTLDGLVVANVCYPTSGSFEELVTFSSTPGNQTLKAQQLIAGTWTDVVTRTVTVVATSGSDVLFGTDSATALANLMVDLDIATIRLTNPGSSMFHDFRLYSRAHRTASFPLTIKNDAGVDVILDGSGLSRGDGPFNLGSNNNQPGVPSAVTDYITIKKGTGGSLKVQNYPIGSAGIALLGWTSHVEVSDIVVRTCTGDASQNKSHCVYQQSDSIPSAGYAGHRASTNAFHRWDVVGDAGRTLNGIQTYHNPNVDGLSAHTWTVDKLHRWCYLWGDATLLDIDGWNGTNCDATIDAIVDHSTPGQFNDATGTVKNCNAHGSCGPLSRGTYGSGGNYWSNAGSVTDGGGNSA